MALTRPSIPYEVPQEEPTPHIEPVELPEAPIETPAPPSPAPVEEPIPA
jgi:hypothetical protein